MSDATSDISAISIGGTRYNVKDAHVRSLVSPTATSENPLQSASDVAASVQGATPYFRGVFANWASVPSEAAGYTYGTPTDNDVIVVKNSADHGSRSVSFTSTTKDLIIGEILATAVVIGETTYAVGHRITSDDADAFVTASITSVTCTFSGTWLFRYHNTWETVGKNGWRPDYMISTSTTADELAALNSGVDKVFVASQWAIGDMTPIQELDPAYYITSDLAFIQGHEYYRYWPGSNRYKLLKEGQDYPIGGLIADTPFDVYECEGYDLGSIYARINEFIRVANALIVAHQRPDAR